jgi:hypothetical protein
MSHSHYFLTDWLYSSQYCFARVSIFSLVTKLNAGKKLLMVNVNDSTRWDTIRKDKNKNLKAPLSESGGRVKVDILKN